MVRKRAKRSAKKYSDSEEDSDSDVSDSPQSAAPRRYGLRQRKQQIVLCEEFDYDEDEANMVKIKEEKSMVEDEEYKVEVDLNELNDYPVAHSRSQSSSASAETEPLMENSLIDFEDVIRADVVMNLKQALERENGTVVIPDDPEPVPVLPVMPVLPVPVVYREKGRRGRPKKSKPTTSFNNFRKTFDNGSSYSQTSPEEHTSLEVQIDPLTFIQADYEETPKQNGDSNSNSMDRTVTFPVAGKLMNEVEKHVPPELDDKEKEVVLSNEYLLSNCFDLGADEFLEKKAQISHVQEEEPVPLINFDDDSDDDDVLIIEKPPEIIVLDDDD